MATRQAPPIQIFQDPMPSPSIQGPSKPRPQLQPSAMPLQPVPNVLNHSEPIFAAPFPQLQPTSPRKGHPVPPPQPGYSNMGYVNIPPPTPYQVFTDSPTKRPPPQIQHYRPEPISQQPLFTTFSSTFDSFEQENYHPSSSMHDNADFPEPSYLRKHHLKRSYSDVHPSSDRPIKKPRMEGIEEAMSLPEPEDMPGIEDDGNKPPYSYAQMIGMAILRAPHRRLTLAQIYEWISTTFAFYREDTKQGWHNSIRHNLSLNKAFNKVERPKGDAGKGCYWVVEPGMEKQFLKDKNRKGNNISNITIHATVMRPDIISASQPMPELAPAFMAESLLDQRPQTAPALPELSSDATLPASDPALVGDEAAVEANMQPISSPPDAINSSPPVAIHRRSGSSPTRTRQPSSILRHKRNATVMDDSGYFSSIESSILRPNNRPNIVLTSELDVEPARKTKRGGRAEDEIQRIRSSSHDLTPSHRRTRSLNFALDPQSSSPIHPSPLSRDNPLTPAIVFKKPMRPPMSVSPNTQLHLHRKAMQEFTNSPIKAFSLFESPSVSRAADSLPETWSPLRWSATSHPQDEFEIFSDPAVIMTPATPGYASSPLKSIKRPGFTRATTAATANGLSEMLGNTSHRLNTKTPSRTPKMLKPSPSFMLSGSPLKGSMTSVAIVDEEGENDFFDFENFESENELSDEGVDLSKGFGKIGAMAPVQKRPGLGRSLTSRF